MTDEEVALHLNPPITQDQLIALAEQERERLLAHAHAHAVMLDWQTELMLGEISIKDKEKLSEWVAYKKVIKSVNTTAATDITWPDMPA